MSITPSADLTLRGCAGGHHVGNSTGDRRLVAESILVTVLAGLRPALTSLSYLPQVKKAWPRDSTEDLSWKTLSALTSGLAPWIIDGLAKVDWVIVAERGWGNALGYRVVCKIRDMTRDYRHGAAQVCPTAGRLGKASEKNCRLSIC